MFKEAGLRSPRTQRTKVKIEISVRGRRTEANTRLEAPQSIISDNNVRWSKIFWAYMSRFRENKLVFPMFTFYQVAPNLASVIVGCQQSCRVFRKTAPLTTFHQVDIVYLYIGQHNNICFFSPFRRKGPFSPTFCKHANFSEEVARRILNSEFLTVRFLFRKDRERGVLPFHTQWQYTKTLILINELAVCLRY